VARKRDGSQGASCYSVEKRHLTFMLSLNFSVTKMAELLGVSRRTITRRMK